MYWQSKPIEAWSWEKSSFTIRMLMLSNVGFPNKHQAMRKWKNLSILKREALLAFGYLPQHPFNAPSSPYNGRTVSGAYTSLP